MPLNRLISQSWNAFVALQSMPCVISDAIPILWFGDLEAYSNSPIRIVTVGLNPSNKEFQDKDCDPISVALRFHNAVSLLGKQTLNGSDFMLYRQAMNEYFKCNPYKRWFQWHEAALNDLDATYGGIMLKQGGEFKNTAIHIDIKTAIATNPTWGGLCNNCRSSLQLSCSKMYGNLVKLLDPQVIIIALDQNSAKSNFGVNKNGCDTNLSYNVHPAYIRTYPNVTGRTLIWTRNMNGLPWGGMKLNDPAKTATLQKIAAHLCKTFTNTKPITI